MIHGPLLLATALFGVVALADKPTNPAVDPSQGGYNPTRRSYSGASTWGDEGPANSFGKARQKLAFVSSGKKSARRRENQAAGAEGEKAVGKGIDGRGRKYHAIGDAAVADPSKASQQLREFGDEDTSHDRRKLLANQLKAIKARTSNGDKAFLANQIRDQDNTLHGRGFGSKRRLNDGFKLETTGCTESGKGSDCDNAEFTSNDKRTRAKIRPDKTDGEEQTGTLESQSARRRPEVHTYTVRCRNDGKDGCAGSPVMLRDERGQTMQCNTAVKRGVKQSRCCGKNGVCVESVTDADGNVEVRRARAKTAGAKCKEMGRWSTQDGQIARKYSCGVDTAGDFNSNVQDISPTSGASCAKYEDDDGREIIVTNAQFVADHERDGPLAKNFEFPMCGTMSADVEFKNFSPAELRELGPRLAWQWSVLVRPAGTLKCHDTQSCIAKDEPANRGDAIPGDNCYYCDVCASGRKKGVLSGLESNSGCEGNFGTKRTISARVCPLSKDDKEKICSTFSKPITEISYHKTITQDFVGKLAIYVRQEANYQQKKATEFARNYRNPFWRLTTGNVLKLKDTFGGTDKILANMFARSNREPEEESDKLYRAYMAENARKGALLHCETISFKYNLAGDKLTKWTDAATTALNFRNLLRKSGCSGLIKEQNNRHRRLQQGSLRL